MHIDAVINDGLYWCKKVENDEWPKVTGYENLYSKVILVGNQQLQE